jgi:hypothetical protein
MKPLITAKDVEDVIKRGGSPAELPRDAVYTPSARDIIQEWERNSRVVPTTNTSGRPAPTPRRPPTIERFFNSPEINVLKERICDMGRRIWANVTTWTATAATSPSASATIWRSARPRSSPRAS